MSNRYKPKADHPFRTTYMGAKTSGRINKWVRRTKEKKLAELAQCKE